MFATDEQDLCSRTIAFSLEDLSVNYTELLSKLPYSFIADLNKISITELHSLFEEHKVMNK